MLPSNRNVIINFHHTPDGGNVIAKLAGRAVDLESDVEFENDNNTRMTKINGD